ncbi:MAG: ATP-binding cassette domain-containing protein [Planctomycetota bacterium]
MIELSRITKRFGSHAALDGVDLSIPKATTTALIGPSGCGKSTLLRVIIGLIEADEGEVTIEGRPLAAWNQRELRQRFGYAIQSGGLFPHLTARQNIELPARAHRCALKPGRIAELAELTHLDPSLLDRFSAELSGGQRQRVALVRALVLDPDILLLDEPLGALDPMVRADLQRDLKSLFDELNKTVVLVTHDLAEAAYLAPADIVLLREGRIAQRGAFAHLRAEPAEPFVTSFIEAQTERVAALVGAVP